MSKVSGILLCKSNFISHSHWHFIHEYTYFCKVGFKLIGVSKVSCSFDWLVSWSRTKQAEKCLE